MATMTNWKNVNNWHWTAKNCTSWSHDYLTEALKSFTASNDQVDIKIKQVDLIEGDVDVNQRKGKILYFYDLKIKCHWCATTLDKSLKSSGSFTIPEFSHEVKGPNELSFQVDVNDETHETAIFRANIAKVLREPIFELLKRFHKELGQVHGQTLIVPYISPSPSAVNVAASSRGHKDTIMEKTAPYGTTTERVPAKDASAQSVTIKEAFSTGQIKHSVEFMASAHDLYHVLTDTAAISAWSRGQVHAEGDHGLLKLFDGNVSCQFIEKIQDKKIVMKWRFSTWPSDHFSIATIDLHQSGQSTSLTLTQTNVPSNDLVRTEANWHEYYWNSIKRVFGYGLIL